MSSKSLIRNQNGNVMIVAVALVALTGALIITGTSVLESNLKNRSYRIEQNGTQYAVSSAVTLLQDQRFCSAFFSSGYNTPNNATYAFEAQTMSGSTAFDGYMKSQISELKQKINKDYRIDIESIQLTNRVQIAKSTQGVNDETVGVAGEPLHIYDVSFQIRPTQGAGGITRNKVIGTNSVKKSGVVESPTERVTLTMGKDTGKCIVQKGVDVASGLNANVMACAAVGGRIDATTKLCRLDVYKIDVVDNMEVIQPKIVRGSPANFSDALCQMELNILRKKRTPASGYKTSDLQYAWTQFCQKPQWSGCRDGATNQNIPLGATTDRIERVEKAKSISKWVDSQAKTSMDVKSRRLFGYASGGAQPDTSAFGKSSRWDRELNKWPLANANLLGGALLVWAASGNGELAANVFAVNLVFGPIGGVVFMMLAPKCDKARAIVKRTCVDGQMEVSSIRVETQKLKIKKFKFTCPYSGPHSDTNLPTDQALYDAVLKDQGKINLPGASVIKVDAIDLQADSVIQGINQVTSLAELVNTMKGDEDWEDMDMSGLSEKDRATLDRILTAMSEKEKLLVNGFISDLSAALKSLEDVNKELSADPTNATYLQQKEQILRGLQDKKDMGQAYVNAFDRPDLGAARRESIDRVKAALRGL